MNSIELKTVMLRNNDNGKNLADYLGLSYPSFSHKITGKTDFNATEISKIRSKYSLTDEELVKIFFS